MKILYLDESGSSNLENLDKNYPIFILGGVLVDENDLKYNQNLINELKRKYFNTTDVILHWTDINHHKKEFSILKNPKIRAEFSSDIDKLIMQLKIQVIACIIKKEKWLEKYDWHTTDPYEYSLTILIDRIIPAVEFAEKINIFAESREKILDKPIIKAFKNIQNCGTRFNSPEKVKVKIKKLEFCKKSDNIYGLQIADLVLSPIGRDYLKKPSEDYTPDCKTVINKCMNKSGKIDGVGIIKLPK
ncbi:MAG: DUF3800 domain-containing protein [Rickettsiales bacterium]|jgi:hypothetical protein|nr:DUF3800 domain-containing protein [Rickettsiales bacterium]